MIWYTDPFTSMYFYETEGKSSSNDDNNNNNNNNNNKNNNDDKKLFTYLFYNNNYLSQTSQLSNAAQLKWLV